MVLEIKDSEFDNEVINSEKPVLVDFWAPWCGPCKMLGPIIQQISDEMGDKVKIVKMNIDDNPDNPSKFGVRSIPTMMIFQNGKQMDAKVGVHPKTSIETWINSSCSS